MFISKCILCGEGFKLKCATVKYEGLPVHKKCREEKENVERNNVSGL